MTVSRRKSVEGCRIKQKTRLRHSRVTNITNIYNLFASHVREER